MRPTCFKINLVFGDGKKSVIKYSIFIRTTRNRSSGNSFRFCFHFRAIVRDIFSHTAAQRSFRHFSTHRTRLPSIATLMFLITGRRRFSAVRGTRRTRSGAHHQSGPGAVVAARPHWKTTKQTFRLLPWLFSRLSRRTVSEIDECTRFAIRFSASSSTIRHRSSR